MAKYAQGYGRKNSDTKNIIILSSVIVVFVALVIGLSVLFSKLKNNDTKSYADTAYAEYYISDYTKLLKQEEAKYLIYVCDATSSDDATATVLAYIDAYKAGKTTYKLYLVDYSKFDSSDDTTESANATSVQTALGFSVSSGTLIAVVDEEAQIANKSKQVITDMASIKSTLNNIKSGKDLSFLQVTE